MISQVNVYVMDVVLILCDVEVIIQQRVVWFCEKASLRICCIILFECKGLGILKTNSLIF